MKIRTKPIVAIAVLGALVTFGATLRAALPLAGTPIGNQAKATYSDDSGVTREVLSNTVITTVSQVYGLTLVTDNQTKTATPGSQVYFSHTVTNTGNGIDTYALATANKPTSGTTDVFDLTVPGSGLFVYADEDQDGLPDNWTPINTTGPLAPGTSFHVVVAGIVPPTATAGQNAQVTIKATSSDGVATLTNTDNVTVTNGPVITVTKAINKSSSLPSEDGSTGTKYTATYTLTYTNTGNAAALNVTIKDVIPSGLTYKAGSAVWSVGSTALTDADSDKQGSSPNQISYRYENGAGSNTLEAVIDSVAAGQSGTITFDVTVNDRSTFYPATVLPKVVLNTAQFGFSSTNTTPTLDYSSNTVPFTIKQDVDVTFTGQDVTGGAPAGSTVVWSNTLTNKGSGVDTFDITLVPGNDFPSGTTFQLYQSDGQTPLVDSNGNSTPDTGPLNPGATYVVVLKAILPTNANGNNGGNGFTVTKRGTSTVDPTVHADAVDTLDEINGASVDLTNDDVLGGANVKGDGAGPETTVVVTNTTNPGATTVFSLYVNNTGPFADSFNLSVGSADTGTGGLPTGWTVVFKKAGVSVTNTGSIPAGGATAITAEVTPPAGTPAGTYPVYFKVISPVNSAASDIIYDAVTVNTVRGLSLQTDQVGQTYPGGSVVYEHILKNNSNVVEGKGGAGQSEISFPTLTDSLSSIGFTSVLYLDTNNDGILDANDTVITTQKLSELAGKYTDGNAFTVGDGLGIGKSVRVFVKVFAPLGAPDNASNATTLTVNIANSINSVGAPGPLVNTDTTSVTRGDLDVVKKQALDEDEDDDADAAFTTSQLSATPGTRILYQVTVTNTGSANATSIVVNDTAPANTTLDTTFTPTVTYDANTGGTTSAAPDTSVPNTLSVPVGTLVPGGSVTVVFAVKINQ